MAKIKGFSILRKVTWQQLWAYKHFWEEWGVEIKFTAFKEAHEWLADTPLLDNEYKQKKMDEMKRLGIGLTDLEKELQERGFIAHWQFDEEHLETVIDKWLYYKANWEKLGLPENGDGVE